MTMARQHWHYILLFLTFLSLALAASPTTFCKCTCTTARGTNSTIIPLNDPSHPAPFDNGNTSLALHRTCNDCTRKFCLDYRLPICADATEDDVTKQCFQRDSTKDEAIVLIFCFATVGLLIWGLVKPWVMRWRPNGVLWHQYGPIGGGGQ